MSEINWRNSDARHAAYGPGDSMTTLLLAPPMTSRQLCDYSDDPDFAITPESERIARQERQAEQ